MQQWLTRLSNTVFAWAILISFSRTLSMLKLSYKSRPCFCSSRCFMTYVSQNLLNLSFTFLRSSSKISNTLSPKRNRSRISRQKIASPLQLSQQPRKRSLKKAKVDLHRLCRHLNSWRTLMKMLSAKIVSVFLWELIFVNTPFLQRMSILRSTRCSSMLTRHYIC